MKQTKISSHILKQQVLHIKIVIKTVYALTGFIHLILINKYHNI